MSLSFNSFVFLKAVAGYASVAITENIQMIFQELTVRRNASYETPSNQIVSKVKFKDEFDNEVITVLSPSATGRILDQIKVECGEVAKNNAKKIAKAALHAADECHLVAKGNSNLLEHENDDPF